MHRIRQLLSLGKKTTTNSQAATIPPPTTPTTPTTSSSATPPTTPPTPPTTPTTPTTPPTTPPTPTPTTSTSLPILSGNYIVDFQTALDIITTSITSSINSISSINTNPDNNLTKGLISLLGSDLWNNSSLAIDQYKDNDNSAVNSSNTHQSYYVWNVPISVTPSSSSIVSNSHEYFIQLIIDDSDKTPSEQSLIVRLTKKTTNSPQNTAINMCRFFDIREKVNSHITTSVTTIWTSEIDGYFPEVVGADFVINDVADTFNDYCINYMLCHIFIALRINRFKIMTDKVYHIIFTGKAKATLITSFHYAHLKNSLSSAPSPEPIPFNFYTTIYGNTASTYPVSKDVQHAFTNAYSNAPFNTDAKDTDINGTNYKSYIINHGITEAEYNNYMSAFKTSLPNRNGTSTQFNDVPQQILIALDAAILQNGSKKIVTGGNHKKHVHKYTNITRRKKRRNSRRRPRVSKSVHRRHRTRNKSYPYTHKTSKRRQTQ